MIDPFTIPSSDQFKSIFLDSLFGPLMGGAIAGSNPFGELLRAFNAGVLMLAGLMVSYTLVAGTIQTAHNGQMLGGRWSSLWLPIRIAGGSGVLLPMKSGFCLAQMAVMWMASQGIGLADKVWSSFVSDPMAGASYVLPDQSTAIRSLAANMLAIEACRQSYIEEQAQDKDTGGFGQVFSGPLTDQVAPVSNGQGTTSFGPCGSVFQATSAQIVGDGNVPTSNTGRALTNARQLAAGLWPIHAQQIRAMESDAAALVAQGPLTQDAVNAYLDRETSRYQDALQAALQASHAATMNQDVLANMQKDGWSMAGAYYLQLSEAQDQLTNAVSTLPTVSVGDTKATDLHPNARQAVLDTQRFTQNANSSSKLGLQANSDMDTGLGAKVLSWFTQGKGVSLSSPTTLNENPIVRAKQLGNSMITWGWGTLGAGIGAGGVGGIAAGNIGGKIVGADTSFMAGITLVAPFVFALSFSLISTGYALAGYLPMVPYILWLGSMIGFLILLVEAIFAAPILAFTHIIPDSDGLVGRAGQGYMLILSMTLRPALMVMGLVASIVLMKPIGFFINETFEAAYNLAVFQRSGWGGLTLTIGGCILYFVVLVSTIHRVFSLIHAIPDSIMRWMGGPGGGELGAQAEKTEGRAHHSHVASVGAMTGVATSISAVGSNIKSGLQERDRQKNRKEALDSLPAQPSDKQDEKPKAD